MAAPTPALRFRRKVVRKIERHGVTFLVFIFLIVGLTVSLQSAQQ